MLATDSHIAASARPLECLLCSYEELVLRRAVDDSLLETNHYLVVGLILTNVISK